MNLKELTIKQAHELLEKREVSSVELTKEFLKNIKEKDPDIHAFLSVTEDEAIKTAKKVDDRIAKGEPKRSATMPIWKLPRGAIPKNIRV